MIGARVEGLPEIAQPCAARLAGNFNSVGVRPFGVRGGFDSLALPPLNFTVSSRDLDHFLAGDSM